MTTPIQNAEGEGDDERRWPAKKNRRRWCGGHVGREHVLRVEDWRATRCKVLVCIRCGKQLKWWMPMPWDKNPTPPEWVKSPDGRKE